MFIDETVIEVAAGDGGNGCFSYNREKYKPKGKPNGGNGGRGGNVILRTSANVHTLQDVSYRRSYKAERGQHGKGSNQYGRSGEDIVITVPKGTVIYDYETNEQIVDCAELTDDFVIAKGGRGGRGNAALVNKNNHNPEYAEYGKSGEKKKLRFVLKMLADIGFVGRPNAGKSTLLSVISKARPKIADYPFTTMEPHLGIVKTENEYRSLVVADIPGLIEGSNEGKGLGIRFLRHIERTKALAIMVESTVEDPEKEAEVLLDELRDYSSILAEKNKCFVLTKTDLCLDDELPKLPEWIKISAVSGNGISELTSEFAKMAFED